MSAPPTGETTAEINSRSNDASWHVLLPLLRAGGTLRRERTGYYYVEGRGGLTPARIRKLEQDGVIRRVGVDAYSLASAGQ